MKRWLYFFVDEQGRSYKTQNGVVSKVAQPTPLPNSPDGWQDINIGWERNMNRFGIVRNFSLPLGFVKGANHILRTIALTENVETRVFLLIKKLELEITGGQYRWIYRYFYKGELDLSSADLGEEKSTVNILESGVVSQVASKEATAFEYDLVNDPDAVSVYHEGYPIINRVNHSFFDFNTDISLPGIVSNYTFALPVSFVNREGITGGDVIVSSSFFERLDIVPDLTDSSNYFFRSVPGFSFTLKGNLKFKFDTSVSPEIDREFELKLMGSSGATYYTWPQQIVTNNTEYEILFNESIDISIILGQEESFFFVGFLTVSPNRSTIFYIIESSIRIEFPYVYPATITKGFTLETLFKKLVKSITGTDINASSNLLSQYRNLVISCGDAMRELEKAVVKTSLQDLFNASNAWLSVAMSVIGKIVSIESKTTVFDASATPFHLGKAKNLKVSFASDLFFNMLKTGYAEHSYEEALGKFEFNNTSEFLSPITKKTNELQLISPYRADPTGIEYQRIKYRGQDTTDSPSDNSVFVLNVDVNNPNVDGSFNLYKPTYDAIQGIPDESVAGIFNIEQLTPKRILKTHGNWIRSVLYGFEADKLRFQTTQKNRELRTVLNGVTIDEDADEIIGNLAAPLFLNRYAEFEAPSAVGIVDALETNPNQPFSFEWEGETFIGFLIKAGIAPDSNKEQTFKLLLSPGTDPTKFI
jgi:hypothetical protein